MYKELIISIIIVILIIGLDIGTQKYANNAVQETINSLYNIKDKTKEGNRNDDEILKQTSDLYSSWLNQHRKLAIFIEHDELEKVETDFVTCKSYMESKQYDMANAELEKTIFVLEHISDKYSFNFENIF